MYWPNGVPRVYAVNGPGIASVLSEEEEKVGDKVVDHEDGVPEEKEESVEPGERADDSSSSEPKPKPEAWANEPIIGLCVSRSGHMFATITKSSIVVWQTKVCDSSPLFSDVGWLVN